MVVKPFVNVPGRLHLVLTCFGSGVPAEDRIAVLHGYNVDPPPHYVISYAKKI